MSERRVIGGGDGELEVALSSSGARVEAITFEMPDGARRHVLRPGPGEHGRDPRRLHGATVGRFANRIAGGELPLDGEVHRLPTNEGDNTLHGGPDGFDRREWQLLEAGQERAVFGLTSPDGDQGFPGTLRVRATFEVTGPTLLTTYDAETDAATAVNLTSHLYFGLADEPTGHRVRVLADRYLPTDDSQVPVGIAPVDGTGFDLREPVPVDPDFDNCWLLGGDGMRPVATLEGGGLRVMMATDQPGLQVFAGGGLVDGVALEPQHLPDSVHHPDWPSTVLRPGEHYRWRSAVTVEETGS